MNNNNHHHNDDNITPAALLEQLVYVDTFMPEIDDPSQVDERLTAELSAFADDSFVFPDEDKPKQDDQNNDNLHQQSEHLLNRFNEINESFSNSPASNLGNNNGIKTFSTLQQSNFNTGISNILSPLSSLNNHSLGNQSLNNHSLVNHSLSNRNSNHNNQQQELPPNSVNTNDLLTTLPKVAVPPGAQSSLIAAGLSQTQIDALAALIAQHQGESQGPTVPNDTTAVNALNNRFESHPNFKTEPNDIEFNHVSNSVNPSATTNSSSTGSTPGASSLSRRGSIKVEPTGDADLDKRRRNTAASARFRIKKKLKEQQLERSVRELNELTLTLEKKIQTLEMENKLLRNLVVEKGEQRNNEELEQLRLRAKSGLNEGKGLEFNDPRSSNF